MKKVEFKFDTYDRVNTPLVDNAIVTMLGVQDSVNRYYIENNVNGVANTWWAEDQLTKA